MKRKQSLGLTMLCLIGLSLTSSCSAAPLLPKLEDRRLRISPDRPGLFYQYEECVRRFIGICTKTEWKEEFYDLNDPEMRARLINMGFTAVSDRRWGE
jgi:hypothetical protein